MILNLSSAQDPQVLDYRFNPIEPRPQLTAPDLEHEFRSQHYSPLEELDEQGNFHHSAVPYTPSPVINTEGVVQVPLSFGAAPMSQIDAALAAQQAVDALAPTHYEQETF